VLFLKRDTPSIELCRVTSSRRRDSQRASTDDDDALPSLRVMRTLALPAFHLDYRVHTAYMQTDRHIEHQHQRDGPEAHPPSQEERVHHEQEEELQHRPPPPRRAPAPLPFHSAPEDMVVGITFLLRLRGPHAIWKKVVTTISHRALFALAAGERFPADGDDDDCEVEEGEGDDGPCGGEEGQAGEDGANEDEDEDEVQVRVGQAVVPWEAWGPRAARVIAPSSFQWITAHAGQRWLSLESDRLVIRDFSAVRVRRARARARARISANIRQGGDDDSPPGDGTTRAATAAAAESVIRGGAGTCFKDDVVSSLPFVETHVSASERTRDRDMVLTDGERLVAFVRAVSQPAICILFFFFC
jgi:hypothetical protein